MTHQPQQEKEQTSKVLLEVLKFHTEQIKMLANTFDEMTKILQSRDKPKI